MAKKWKSRYVGNAVTKEFPSMSIEILDESQF